MSNSNQIPKLFITHSWKDIDFARRLTDDLIALGLNVFMDAYSIKPGDNITERIGDELGQCDIYIPIISSAALKSRWCLEEINAAITLSNENDGHPLIIPVLIENCQRKMSILLRTRRNINFTDQYQKGLQELTESAFGLISKQTSKSIRKKHIDDDIFVFPTSIAQRSLFLFDQLRPGVPYFNIPFALRITGPLNISIFQKCINEIIRRHESLRTTFATHNKEPVQIIRPKFEMKSSFIDLSYLSCDIRENAAMLLAKEEAQRAFDLSNGPLIRTRIFRLSDNDHLVIFTLHHIISDGWSVGVIIREIIILFDAFSAGKHSPLPELPIQYADFALWQKEWLHGDLIEQQTRYWKKQLTGHPYIFKMLTDRPRPPILTFHCEHWSTKLSRELSNALNNICRKESVTLFMTLLSAFSLVLYDYTTQTDICIGSPISNRTRAELADLIGLFVNTLVLRIDLSGQPTFLELLRRIRKVTLEAYANQDIPFETLKDMLQPKESIDYSPLFQVMFILQTSPSAEVLKMDKYDLIFKIVDLNVTFSNLDLSVFISESIDGLEIAVEYNIHLFNNDTIVLLIEKFKGILGRIILNPNQPISILCSN